MRFILNTVLLPEWSTAVFLFSDSSSWVPCLSWTVKLSAVLQKNHSAPTHTLVFQHFCVFEPFPTMTVWFWDPSFHTRTTEGLICNYYRRLKHSCIKSRAVLQSREPIINPFNWQQNTNKTIQNNSQKPASGQFNTPHKNNSSSADGTQFLIKTIYVEGKKVEKGAFFFFYFVILFWRHKKGLIPQTLWKYLRDGYKDVGDLWGISTASCQIFPHPSFHIERPKSSLLVFGMHRLIGIPLHLSWRSPGKKHRRGGQAARFGQLTQALEKRLSCGTVLDQTWRPNFSTSKRLPITPHCSQTLYFSKLKH